jgi:hypothetical protein
MSFFAVTIETIKTIEPIEGADKIVKATLDNIDFSFVVMKDQFKPGDKCVYIPLDALLPDELCAKLGLAGKLAGPAKNKVRTIRLKGVYSQGIATDLSILEGCKKTDPESITKFLGVTKYEPEEEAPKVTTDDFDKKYWPWYKRLVHRFLGRKWVQRIWGFAPGVLRPLTVLNIPVYDIESVQKHKDVVAELMDKPVWVLLKVEGRNAAVYIDKSDKVFVNMRRNTIEKDDKEATWSTATRLKIIDFAKVVAKKYNNTALVYFELAGSNDGQGGITDNIYGWKEYKAFIFDIKVGDKYLNMPETVQLVKDFYGNEDMMAPILCRGELLKDWLARNKYESIEQAAEQKGILNKLGNCLEEGVVLTPAEEYSARGLGRVKLKYRSKAYLAKEK